VKIERERYNQLSKEMTLTLNVMTRRRYIINYVL